MAALRNAARFSGLRPFFAWHLSSSNETSHTQLRDFRCPSGHANAPIQVILVEAMAWGERSEKQEQSANE
jgi:hypothetical protein